MDTPIKVSSPVAGVVKRKQSKELSIHATSICANCHTTRNPVASQSLRRARVQCLQHVLAEERGPSLELASREVKRRTRAVAVKQEEEPVIKKGEAQQPMVEEGVSSSCTHCHTTTTPQWRRNSSTGAQECNACNVYYRKHGIPRPLGLANRRRGGGRAQAVVVKVEEPIHYTPVINVKSEEGLGWNTGKFDFEEFMGL